MHSKPVLRGITDKGYYIWRVGLLPAVATVLVVPQGMISGGGQARSAAGPQARPTTVALGSASYTADSMAGVRDP